MAVSLCKKLLVQETTLWNTLPPDAQAAVKVFLEKLALKMSIFNTTGTTSLFT